MPIKVNRQNSFCFEGDFEVEAMGDIQVNAGIDLLRYLIVENKLAMVPIMRHRDLNTTTCPCKFFLDKIIIGGMKIMPKPEHWAEKVFLELKAEGIDIQERRFDEKITRGESFALMLLLLNKLKKGGI
jgi:hypothetical protein